jgi:hypothetical protein
MGLSPDQGRKKARWCGLVVITGCYCTIVEAACPAGFPKSDFFRFALSLDMLAASQLKPLQ